MLDSRYVRFVVESGKSSTIAASKLSGLDRFTIAADDGALDSTAYVVVRDGDDLVMLFADGTRVVIEDYFTSTASFAFDGLGQAVELPLDAQPIGTVGDKALYAFSGDVDGARTILLESRGFTALEPLLDDAAIAALPAGVGLPLMLPLALGLVVAAGGSTAAAVIQTTIKGLFLAGPIIDGNGLSVDIFDSKGNLLARDVQLNEDGSFSVTLEGTYTSVIAILRDGNEAADYRDEATGLPRDLTAQLMSVGTGQPQGDGTTLVNLNINPITTVAARNAGLGQDGTIPEGGLSDAQINDANKATADAFGLSDVNAVAPLNIFDPAFNDTDGDVSESEKYGQILAMMSGLDQKNNGDQQAAIEEIAATLRNAPDADTAQQQVKDNLTEGAVEFEFKNQGGTENEADLLSSPALGIQNTPDVDTEGASQAPAVTALLDDLASQPDEGDATPITAAQLQQAVNAANALQQLVALGADDAVPTDISDVLDEASLELLGLTGLTPAPSPYLDEFLSVLKAAADDGSATDSVAELQALLDGVIAAGLTPSQTIEPNADGTITVSGQTVPGASVTVAYPDGTSVTVVADENGAYSATSAAPQTSGSVSVSAADSAGNTSAAVVEAYQDETPPVAPTAVLEVNGDGTLSVSGTGEPGSTVTTVFPDGTTGTAVVADDGSYGPITSAAAQPSTNVKVTQQDAAGNLSPAAVDETAPFGPSITDANAAGLSGTAEPGSIVTLFDDSEPPVAIASTTVGEDGTWSIPASAFPDGTTDGFAGAVTATDAAGNESTPAAIAAIDGTAPEAPGVDAANADGLSGTGTAGDVITLFDDSEPPVAIASTTVGEDGSWAIPASAFPDGTTDGFAGAVTATDAAGNESTPAAIAAIDGTAPEAPGVDAANADGVSGTGTAGDVITLFDDSEPPVAIASTTVGEDGSWAIPASAFPDGTTDGFAGAVTATDAAGNESTPAAIAAIDGTAPEAPVVEGANADGLSGTGTAGDVITLFDDSEPPVAIASTTVGEDGTWSIPASDFPGGTTDGFAGAVTATDAAGNVSDPTTVPAIDGTAPAAPGVDAANGDGLSGTGTAGDVIALLDNNGDPVLDGNGAPVTAVVDGDGNWSIPASDFPGGTTDGFAGSVTATDAAGNVSDPTTVPAIDGTAPAAPGVDAANGDGLSGTGTAGDVIALLDNNGDPVLDGNGAPVTAVVDGDGNWSIPASDFPGGTTDGFAGSITATDAAGNVSDPTTVPAIDGTAPEAPGVTTSNSTGITGTGTAGDVITLLDNNGDPVLDGNGAPVTAVVGGDGTWSIPAADFPGGSTTNFNGGVTATDPAGNTSAETDVTIGSAAFIYFGNFADLDPTETNLATENRASLVGEQADYTTLRNVNAVFTNVTGFANTINDNDGSSPGDILTYSLNGQSREARADATDIYEAAITLQDGSTSTIRVVTLQLENGDLFLLDEQNNGTLDNLQIANIEITSNVSIANGYVGALANQIVNNTSFGPTAPTLNAGITDQANTVSGTGDPGAVVTVNMIEGGVSTLVGTATVWTDGTWSFVADSPIADGAVLVATQQGDAGNRSLEAQVTTFTDTDGDGTANTSDTDDDGDGILDTAESQTESESVISFPAQTPAVNMNIGTPTTGYTVSNTVDSSTGDLIDITATAPGEIGTGTTTAALGTGTISRFNYKANVVGVETVENLTIGISIGTFDDGLYVEIDNTVIVDFTGSDYQNLPSMANYNSDNSVSFGFAWAPFNGEGNPELVVDLANSTVQLLVTESDGVTRSDIFAAMLADGFDATPNAVPVVDATSVGGVTIGTGFRNANINVDDGGSISTQTITVTGTFGGAAEIDGDKILNWVDIDTDNDRIWDKYEGASDTDGDGVADYRDTDSDGDGTADGAQASLSASDITALEGSSTNSDGYILLSDAGLVLDLTAVGTNVQNLEYIDMEDGSNAQTVIIDELAIVTVGQADRELVILGEAGDTVDLSGAFGSGFADTGKDISIEGQKFSIYEGTTNDDILTTLIIDDDITVTLT